MRQYPFVAYIPVVGYFLLQRRCTDCHQSINFRYPLVEVLTGALFGLVSWHYGSSLAGLEALLFVAAMITLTFIDFENHILPDVITIPLLWVGLLVNLGGTFTPLPNAVLGAVAGYSAFWFLYWLYKRLTGKEGMGYGDFKLLAAIGAWLGWQMLPLVILTSTILGTIVGISLIILGRHDRNIPIPFGPYLATAGIVAMLWGSTLNQYIPTFI